MDKLIMVTESGRSTEKVLEQSGFFLAGLLFLALINPYFSKIGRRNKDDAVLG
ncbi:hypothetical protein [Brevibacillus migulae]|uniref:hypothetical protein n=1 Tax=Brevibacillus migulae TaxID=1644114 RepID=UPI0014312437|nr:hypothetical protein [Brevibacillus migulae]